MNNAETHEVLDTSNEIMDNISGALDVTYTAMDYMATVGNRRECRAYIGDVLLGMLNTFGVYWIAAKDAGKKLQSMHPQLDEHNRRTAEQSAALILKARNTLRKIWEDMSHHPAITEPAAR